MKTIIRTVLFILCVLLTLSLLSCESFDPKITMLLKDQNGLQVGDVVSFKGMPIGAVRSVDLIEIDQSRPTFFAAELEIERDKFRYLYHEMDFKVERVNAFSVQKMVVVEDRHTVKMNRLKRNDYVLGRTSTEQFFEGAQEILQEIMRESKPLRERFKERVFDGVRNLVRQIERTPRDTTGLRGS